ncbi:type II toxin-antitoxin system RelE/ParE family toxin [Nitrospirillum amazonense]|uniref:type II toxin-antitoxin system RelE/ParE family toxin n=1 Tax=Nitrospirillum amazonense TaxID=28077 RepID=UPI0011A6F988
MRLRWSPSSLRDVVSLQAHIARHDPQAAESQLRQVVMAAKGLLRFPEMGRPGRHAGTRELVVTCTPYLIAYRIRGDRIDILRVLHGRQLWPDALK